MGTESVIAHRRGSRPRPVTPSREVGSWDEETDVIVVGSGAAGMVAGSGAAAGGARVILLEKEQLAERIDERLAGLTDATAGLRLDADFVTELKATIDRFNRFVRQGQDDAWRAGRRVTSHLRSGWGR